MPCFFWAYEISRVERSGKCNHFFRGLTTGEIIPKFANKQVILAYEEDGKFLPHRYPWIVKTDCVLCLNSHEKERSIMQQWEYLLLAVSINAWQKPAPAVSVIDGSGQITQHTFPAFHAYVNGLGELGWQLAHVEEHCWVFQRLKPELAYVGSTRLKIGVNETRDEGREVYDEPDERCFERR